jgi:hypothetical protein
VTGVKTRKRFSDRQAARGRNVQDELMNTLWLWSLALASDDLTSGAFVRIDLGPWSPSYRPYARA